MITSTTSQNLEPFGAMRSAAHLLWRRPTSLLVLICIVAYAPMAASSDGEANLPWLLANWQSCFTKKEIAAQDVAAIVAACDRAATSVNLSAGERRKLAARRLKLLESAEQKQETDATNIQGNK